jgi:hypothetical protein
MYTVSNILQMDLHRGEWLIPEPSTFDAEIAIALPKKYQLPDIHQIPAEHSSRR